MVSEFEQHRDGGVNFDRPFFPDSTCTVIKAFQLWLLWQMDFADHCRDRESELLSHNTRWPLSVKAGEVCHYPCGAVPCSVTDSHTEAFRPLQ
jgi:hypothetical protein